MAFCIRFCIRNKEDMTYGLEGNFFEFYNTLKSLINIENKGFIDSTKYHYVIQNCKILVYFYFLILWNYEMPTNLYKKSFIGIAIKCEI